MSTMTVEAGAAHPLGAQVRDGGVNFSIFSLHATAVELLLFERPADIQPFLTVNLHRTFNFWHAFVDGLPAGTGYAFRVHGPQDVSRGHRYNPNRVLIDPYARANDATLWSRGPACDTMFGESILHQDNLATSLRSVIVDSTGFDWQGDAHPATPMKDSIIYEMHVRGFTQHPNSGVQSRGTYAGIIEKIPYLKSLGVTAVELLPVFEFDETDVLREVDGAGLVNYWGYSTMSFFAPHRAFSGATDAAARLDEFRLMVRELHKAGIEVILDVVFNHTDEGQHQGPTFNFKGFDNHVYYHLVRGDRQYYMDYTGTGNTYNCNHPVGNKLILDSLEYWVSEMHVDGFRFDEGTILVRNQSGAPDQFAHVIWNIELSDVLAETKLIAEAWDAAGEYEIGRFPGYRWAEWNGRYRDSLRKFVRGDEGLVGATADALLGSASLYQRSGHLPINSINFITCHDGFTLNDLVSYNVKHNDANGEGNRDGNDDNMSCNYGVEGPSDEAWLEALRERQIRNFTALQMLSIGVPMITAGDEVRRTQQGNNNAYCQDSEISWFDWSLADRYEHMRAFFSAMIGFRKEHECLRKATWFDGSKNERGTADIEWHGTEVGQPDWSDGSRCLAYTLAGQNGQPDLHILANMYWEPVDFALPGGREWHLAVNTDREGEAAVQVDAAPAGERVTLPGRTVQVYLGS